MKFTDLKQWIIMTICAMSLMALPIASSAAPATFYLSNTQTMDRVAGTNDALDAAKDDIPPKPSPKPGPRDGGADD